MIYQALSADKAISRTHTLNPISYAVMIYEGLSADKAFSGFQSMGIKDFIVPYCDATVSPIP